MKQVGVYYIPNNHGCYATGSSILGYDIDKSSLVKTKPITMISRARKMNEVISKYGFHLTLSDAVEIDDDVLEEVASRVRKIFGLDIFKNIILRKRDIEKMPNANILAIKFRSNCRLWLLHALLVIFVQSLGKRSAYTDEIINFTWFRKLKIRLFHSPYIFDDYLPHISILANTQASKDKKLINGLSKQFEDCDEFVVNCLQVVVHDEKSDKFVIRSRICR